MVSPIAVPMVLQAPPTEPPASVIFIAGAARAMPATTATAATTALTRHSLVHALRMMKPPVPSPTSTPAPAFDNPTTRINVCTHPKARDARSLSGQPADRFVAGRGHRPRRRNDAHDDLRRCAGRVSHER